MWMHKAILKPTYKRDLKVTELNRNTNISA